jgi:hypothetical protein
MVLGCGGWGGVRCFDGAGVWKEYGGVCVVDSSRVWRGWAGIHGEDGAVV